MANMARNKMKRGIDKLARGARKATDTIADASDKNKARGTVAATKVKAAVGRAGDKLAEAGARVREAGARAKTRAKRR
jgi:hypothetical protein